MNNYLVTQSNNLIEAKYREPLLAREQKLVLSVVSMIHPDDEDFKLYNISVKDFHNMMGLEGEPKYSELQAITRKMLGKVVEIQKEKRLLQSTWFSTIEYYEREGKIEFAFDPKLKPYLLQLKEAFTSYRLSNILSLNSAYSIRLYELMKKWQYITKVDYDVGSLKEKLGINKTKYKQYGHFKSRVLSPAIKELNNKTDISVEFKEIRKGRKVEKISFSILVQKQKEIKASMTEDISTEEHSSLTEVDRVFFFELLEASDFDISLETYKSFVETGKQIWGDDDYQKQLLKLVDYVGKQKNIKSEIGLAFYKLKDLARKKAEGLPTTIKLTESNGVSIPDWLNNKGSETSNYTREKTNEEIELEKEELRKALNAMDD
ncbi:replication initiation protein [Pontibacillus yanchengensis]|uniref:Initiator RepB protein n=1 Tax=Pontibacillus yanchengensis Y32 TaxID=1385514 RepID=A0A0A2T9G1_9BACI|nr:replication initiation protein [Pontibacillus yanchengensis]KGP71048.1 initiator RepB protein [Pontibacillus yanchengensis Y32]